MSGERACSVEGCGRTHFAKGFCASHYYRARNGKPLDAPMRPLGGYGETCMVDGCSRSTHCKGFCRKHYYGSARQARAGDAPAPRPPLSCRACDGKVSPLHPSFCLEHAQEWPESKEQVAVLRCLDAIKGVANPRFGPALDALISAAIETFAERVRASPTPENAGVAS